MSDLGRTLSVSSASPGPSNDSNEPIQEVQPPYRRIPFARRRLPRDQALALLAVFEKKTHPTKEEREALSNELGIELKTVSAWFQNKRRSVRKKALAWRNRWEQENPPPIVHGHYRRTYGPLTSRTSLSLDCIATSRERPTPRPRDPLSQRSLNLTPTRKTHELLDHIPSSPIMPPSSPAAESIRLSALPRRTRSNRSLEWACMNARVVRRSKGSIQEEAVEDDDVPMLVMDTESVDAEGDETEVDEAITPDISSHSLDVPSDFTSPATSKPTKSANPDAPQEEMEAAIALLGFMGGRDRASE